MATKSKSVEWNFYDKSTDGAGGICKLCKCVVKTSGNTTNLKNHLKRKHPSINIDTSKMAKTSMSTSILGSSEPDETIDNPGEVNFAIMAKQIVDTANQMQSTLEDYRPQSSMSSCSYQSTSKSLEAVSVVTECSDSDFSDSVLSISTPSTSVCGSVQSLNSPKFKQPIIYESLANLKSYETGGFKTQAITDALAYMIAKDNMPLSMTEKPGFIYFMRQTVPLYKIPSRKCVTKIIQSKYEVLSSLIKSQLSNVQFMTLTADIWTDIINTNSYLGMTVHYFNTSKLNLENVTIGVLELADSHTSVNISEWFDKLLKEWGICKDQIVNVVTDSGANIMSAVKTSFGNDKHLPCFAHTLNLVTQRPLNELADVQTIISKIKTIVTFFKHSVIASDQLRKVCNLKLKQSVPTRWNSIYYMIDRFLICSNHIASILISISRGPSMLSATEIDIAREIHFVLKPFEIATKELCGENYITGSKVIPLIHCLIKKCENIVVINPIAIQLKSALLNNLQRWFGRVEEIQNLSIATILDPRFKTLHSTNPVASSTAIRTICLKIQDLKTNSSGSNKDSSDDDFDETDSLWSFHNELVSKKASENSEDHSERMPTDLIHFFNQPTIGLHENVLLFWNLHKTMYPHIAKIAEPYLSLVATSVPSERLFSKAGNIMTAERNRLKGEKLQQLLFLSSLNIDDWHLQG